MFETQAVMFFCDLYIHLIIIWLIVMFGQCHYGLKYNVKEGLYSEQCIVLPHRLAVLTQGYDI